MKKDKQQINSLLINEQKDEIVKLTYTRRVSSCDFGFEPSPNSGYTFPGKSSRSRSSRVEITGAVMTVVDREENVI
jgi:hypothetical protein